MAQTDAAGFEVWDAFDGRTGAGAELFDGAAYAERVGKSILPGEIGCVLSHLHVLQHFASQKGPDSDVLLVAEDDVQFSTEFETVTRQILKKSRFGWILLANGFEEPGSSPFWSKNRDRVSLSWFARAVGPRSRPYTYRAGRYEGELWGTPLYMVTRIAARQLSDFADRQSRLSWRADDYAIWHRPAGVDVHMLRPGLAGFSGGSEIHPTERGHLTQTEYSASLLGPNAWKRRIRRTRLALGATRRSVTGR